ncbi:MAG: hypothetical protein U5J64_08575 [Halobacteriales archaeon]|nr:hypothetical protein [Halobacteriales archaeon]
MKRIGIEREDKDKSIAEDVRDSLQVGLFNIDNIKQDIDERMDRVDRKLEHVEEVENDARETLMEVEDKLDEIDIRIGILEFKLAGAVILGLVYLSIISAQENRIYVSYSAGILAVVFAAETLITLYRGFFGDFIVKGIQGLRSRI